METEGDLFRHWKNHARTPRSLLEDFVARRGLKCEDVDALLRIVKYATPDCKKTERPMAVLRPGGR